MNYKAIVTDLDGTLLNGQHKVSEYTKDIINKIVEKGIHFMIATGRHHMDVDDIRKSLGLETIMITANGSRVHDFDNNQILGYDIEENIVREILKIESDDEIYRNIYQGDTWLIEKRCNMFDDFHDESGFTPELLNFDKLENYEASKLFYVSENIEKLNILKNKIEEKFPDSLSIAFSLPICLEIMPKGISKGFALEKVLEDYGVSLEETIAFGDGFNDYEMLQAVGKGLIMGNAHDALKKALPMNEVITANHEDGVGRYLEELFL